MSTFYKNKDLKTFSIEVSEEIDSLNLKEFILTSLELQQIKVKNTDALYVNYLNESKQYQVLICSNKKDFLEAELFSSYYINKPKKTIDLYYTNEFFVIYKDSKLYCLKILNEELLESELLLYIKKTFNLRVDNLNKIDILELEKLKTKKIKKHLQDINILKSKAFIYFIFYLLCLCLFAYFYLEYLNKEEKTLNKNLEEKYSKLKKEHKYIPFESEVILLLESLKKYNTSLKKASFTRDSLYIVIQSKNKKDIYSFLETYKNRLLSNELYFLDSHKIYECNLNVQVIK